MSDNNSTTPAASNESKPKIWATHHHLFTDRAITIEYAEAAGVFSFEMKPETRTDRILKRVGAKPPNIPNYPGATGIGLPFPPSIDKIKRIRFRIDQKTITLPGPTEGSNHGEKTVELPRWAGQYDIPVSPYFTQEVLDVADDTSVAIYACEGGFKPLALSCNGFPAFGLCGVLAGAHNPQLLKEWGEVMASKELRDRIRWKGRKVYIVFDAFIDRNPMVALGAAYLWMALRKLGADIWIVTIPPREPGEVDLTKGESFGETDSGPDDYLAFAGNIEFKKRVDEAVPFDPEERARFLKGRPDDLRAAVKSLSFQACLHVAKKEGEATIITDVVSALGKGSYGKRELSKLGDSFAEKLIKRAKEDAETVLVRGDQAELAQVLLRELGGADNCVYDNADLWAYDGPSGVFVQRDQDALAARVARKAGAPTGESGRPLMVSDSFAVGAVNLAWKTVKETMGAQDEKGFFGSSPRCVGFANGVLVVSKETGRLIVDENGIPKLHPHGKEWRLRHKYDFDYVPGLVPAKRLAFLNTCFAGDPECEAKIQLNREFGGASMFGEAPRFQKSLVFQGIGADGKSIYGKMLEDAMPPGSSSHIAPGDLESEYNRAGLAGKVLNVVYDLPEKQLLDTGSIKAAITGDTLKARNPYGRVFDVPPIAGHLILLNRLPPVTDNTKGFRRRWIILRFPNSVDEKDIDAFYRESMNDPEEIQAFVSWLVDGFATLTARGRYDIPASSDRLVNEWLKDNDQVAQFVEAEVEVLDGDERAVRKNWMAAQAAYDLYRDWAKRTGHQYPKNKTNFGKELKEILKLTPKDCDGRNGICYPIRIAKSDPADTAEKIQAIQEADAKEQEKADEALVKIQMVVDNTRASCRFRDAETVIITMPDGSEMAREIAKLGSAYRGDHVIIERDGESYRIKTSAA